MAEYGEVPVGRRRTLPISKSAPIIFSTQYDSARFRGHVDFYRAKAGDVEAAIRFVEAQIDPASVDRARVEFGSDVVFLAPIAIEATGANAIPQILADRYAEALGARSGHGIVQINRAFHTGADLMERLVAPVYFDGEIEAGARYVLVDDVTTGGGTLASLADFVQAQGGEVVGVVTLASGSRSGELTAPQKVVTEIERRFGDAIREEFNIEPAALTADEAGYLIGFRNADEIRNRAAKARAARAERRRSKGLRPPPPEEVAGGDGSFPPSPSASSDGPASPSSDWEVRESRAVYGVDPAAEVSRFHSHLRRPTQSTPLNRDPAAQ